MKQQCHLAMIWLSWAVYVTGLAGLLWIHQWILAAAWLICVPLAQAFYVRKFPAFSAAVGYGPITDQPAPVNAQPAHTASTVTLYTALGCPFCPLLERRIEALRATMGFTLRTIDVTLRPDLLRSQGILSVPAVEINGRILTGLVSSEELAASIAAPAVAAAR